MIDLRELPLPDDKATSALAEQKKTLEMTTEKFVKDVNHIFKHIVCSQTGDLLKLLEGLIQTDNPGVESVMRALPIGKKLELHTKLHRQRMDELSVVSKLFASMATVIRLMNTGEKPPADPLEINVTERIMEVVRLLADAELDDAEYEKLKAFLIKRKKTKGEK